jgi:predicted nucleotidyltransferase
MPDAAAVERVLGEFLAAAREALGPALRSAVLFGSAAEGRLRPASDVNLLLVVAAFDPAAIDRVREPLRVAEAALDLRVMWLREDEVAGAAARFASKFADILRRRKVLHGRDPFASLAIPRSRQVERLRTESLNLVLRLRALYASRSLREEQAARAAAEVAGPLRGMAALLLDLEGAPAPDARAALRAVAAAAGPEHAAAVDRLPEARASGVLPPGVAGPTLLRLLETAERIRARAEALA